ncbi:hypothetical protein VitviT2T_020371 [Vitis vinifera]|uniref:Bulb-type lectin domain-containing protein n=1 Tax=Vitis vinifera TaxID=29760 RepID=A0ABY9D3S8_VITVI|nr:hypothetical protein VitviT2T_020371 [Vitis vinifera]
MLLENSTGFEFQTGSSLSHSRVIFYDVESEPSDQDDAGCKNFLEALQTASTEVTYATMLDIGNLMLAGCDPTYFWQSFNPPTDTILPTQMLNQGSKLVARFSEKNPEVNYKKIDKSDELLKEDLKLENEWQQVSTCSEMNMASSSPNMLTMYKGLFTQPSAI